MTTQNYHEINVNCSECHSVKIVVRIAAIFFRNILKTFEKREKFQLPSQISVKERDERGVGISETVVDKNKIEIFYFICNT